MPAMTSLPIKKRDNATLPELTFLVGSVFYTTFAPDLKKHYPLLPHVCGKTQQRIDKFLIIFGNFGLIMKKILFMTVIMTSMVLTSCNVTRTVTTRSETYQQGDTAVVIQSRTVESYDATKKINIY